MLEIENLTLQIGEKIILDNISISSFGNLGIIGKSGSGKSSFLKSLLLLFSPPFSIQAKTLKIMGHQVLHLHPKALRLLRQKVGFVSSDVYKSFYPLAHIGAVFDSLMKYHYPNLSKSQRKHQAFELMEKMGLDSLELIWRSYIRELSGGMARRVQLASCLACGAKVLLCDEITASLDEENAQKIIQLLKTMRLPLIFATHNLGHLKSLCYEVALLRDGKIIKQGLSETILSSQDFHIESLFEDKLC